MTSVTKGLLISVFALTLALDVSVASAQGAQDVVSLLMSTFTNPASLLTFLIEFILGIGLGYFSTKILKYVLALVGIFVIGVLLNVWQSPQLGANLGSQLAQLGLTWEKISPVIMSFVYMFGLTTVFPITLGFIIGIVIAMAK